MTSVARQTYFYLTLFCLGLLSFFVCLCFTLTGSRLPIWSMPILLLAYLGFVPVSRRLVRYNFENDALVDAKKCTRLTNTFAIAAGLFIAAAVWLVLLFKIMAANFPGVVFLLALGNLIAFTILDCILKAKETQVGTVGWGIIFAALAQCTLSSLGLLITFDLVLAINTGILISCAAIIVIFIAKVILGG